MLQITMGPVNGGMGWLEWSSSVISSTAWPVALVIVALIFHRQITRLLKRIKGAKYGDAELSFTDELDNLEQKVEELLPADPGPNEIHSEQPTPVEPDQTTNPPVIGLNTLESKQSDIERVAIEQEKFNELAAISPNAAVLNAWKDVEVILDGLADRVGLAPEVRKRRHAFGAAMHLYADGKIDKTTMKVLAELRNLRNAAAHGKEVSLPDAFRFEALARQVIDRLRRIGRSYPL